MSTPVSPNTPYCTVPQFFDRFDWRVVGDLLGDEDRRVDLSVMTTAGSPANSRLTSLLQEASGMVESACLKGNRYSVADLQNLSQPGQTSNATLMLAGIVAGIGMWMIWERRSARMAEMQLPTRAQQAVNMLDALEAGEKIFGLQEVMDAGNPTVQYQQPSDIYNRNPISAQARRMFGRTTEWNIPGPVGAGDADSWRGC